MMIRLKVCVSGSWSACRERDSPGSFVHALNAKSTTFFLTANIYQFLLSISLNSHQERESRYEVVFSVKTLLRGQPISKVTSLIRTRQQLGYTAYIFVQH